MNSDLSVQIEEIRQSLLFGSKKMDKKIEIIKQKIDDIFEKFVTKAKNNNTTIKLVVNLPIEGRIGDFNGDPI